VYLCYGLHMMLNVVADKEGVGAAVLIRSCAPVSGMHTSLIADIIYPQLLFCIHAHRNYSSGYINIRFRVISKEL
jgi:hypothetical protein